MIGVDVCVTKRVHEITRFQTRNLRHHHEEQGIGSYIEWYTKKYISRALIELQTDSSVCHVELEEGVARR
jgi:hypothetical protein